MPLFAHPTFRTRRGHAIRLASSTGAALLLAACVSGPTGLPRGRWIDLTHSFDAETIYWPTEEGFVLERSDGESTQAGYYYEAHRFRSAEHGGTHIDAPIHFAAGRSTVDRIPLSRLHGPAVTVDFSAACTANRDYRLGIEDLRRWERMHGRLPAEAIVLLRTGFGRFWPDRVQYMGTDERGPEAIPDLHFPGLHPDAARWLVEERQIAAVGLDTPSIDYGQSQSFETHRVLAAADVPAFENLANLTALPARGFSVVALPMKIRGGSGGPLRIVAIVP
ncbi:MAG: cyclase family protein [Myxococcota bacterium]